MPMIAKAVIATKLLEMLQMMKANMGLKMDMINMKSVMN